MGEQAVRKNQTFCEKFCWPSDCARALRFDRGNLPYSIAIQLADK